MNGSWQDEVLDHAIEKAQALRAQLRTPESRWEDKIAGLKRAGDLAYGDESLPEEFRECLGELLWSIDTYAKMHGPATREDDLWFLVEYAQRLGRVIRESEGRMLS